MTSSRTDIALEREAVPTNRALDREINALGPLTLYELRRAVRHPAFLVALATVCLTWLVPWILDRSVVDLTVVNIEAMSIQAGLLLPAAGAFMAAALIGLADHRSQAHEMLSVAPVSARTRLLAQAGAAFGPAGVVLIVTVVRLVAVSAAAGAAGQPPLVGDVALPAALTLFAAVLATCSAALFRSLAACGAMLAVVGVLTIVGAFAAYGASGQGLTPIMLTNPMGEPPVPTALLTRPAGLHAAYLVGLTLLVLAATILIRRFGDRRWLALVAAAVLLTGGTGLAQVQNARRNVAPSAAWTVQYLHPGPSQRCETSDADTYCAFPDFASRIPYWRGVVTSQRALLPDDGRQPLTVRQRLSPPQPARGGSPPVLPWDAWRQDDGAAGSIPVSTRWARPGGDDYDQNAVMGFSVLSAATLVGWTMPTEKVPRHGEVCGARGVLTAWLATQSSPAVVSAYRVLSAHTTGPNLLQTNVLDGADTVVIGEREMSLAGQLATLPREQLATTVGEHWTELTSPSTSVERAAVLLGVESSNAARVTSVCATGGS